MPLAVIHLPSTRNPFNPIMEMQKIVTLDGFGVRTDPGEYFVKKRNFK